MENFDAGRPSLTFERQSEHQWLQQIVGDWTVDIEATMGPSQPSEHHTGTERVRSLGDLWVLAESDGTMPGGGSSTALMTLGYDPQQRKYVGTFIASMMTYLWVYEGELDAAERVLTLEAVGPGMADDGSMATYRDVIEIISGDHRMMTSHVRDDDGNWNQFMTAHYRRAG